MNDPYDIWIAELLEFFEGWPYPSEDGWILLVDPPFGPLREGLDDQGCWLPERAPDLAAAVE